MQKLYRKTILLKPADGSRYQAAVLRLQKTGQCVSLSIEADKRQKGTQELFLYSKNGAIAAGSIKEGRLFTTLCGLSPDEVYGAAVFDGNALVFKSGAISAFDAKEKRRAYLDKKHKEEVSIYAEQGQDDVVFEPYVNIELQPKTAKAPEKTETAPPKSFEPPKIKETQTQVFFEMPSQKPEPSPQPQRKPFMPAALEDIKNISDECPVPAVTENFYPFESVFPKSSFIKHTYFSPGGEWHYITGTVESGGEQLEVTGVPGKYAPSPPPWLKGFKTHLVSSDGVGYWLMFYNAQTKEPSFPLRSPRGE